MEDLQIDVEPIARWRRGMQTLMRGDSVRVWTESAFRLEVFDSHSADRHGKARLAYCFQDFRMGEIPIFEGQDFYVSPLDAIDSDAVVAALLGYFSLQPGDTDREYFDEYSERQTEWMNCYADELALLAFELEEV